MKKIFVRSTLFLIVFMIAMIASIASADILLGNRIPLVNDGAIVIDGEINDWSEVAPFISDPAGDVSIPAEILAAPDAGRTDLKDYYLARDSEYLYWRIDIYGNSFNLADGDGYYGPVLLFYDTWANCDSTGYSNGVTSQIVNDATNGAYISTRTGCDDWAGWGGGLNYGTINGNWAEGKIPLVLFAQYNINFITAYYYGYYYGAVSQESTDRDSFEDVFVAFPRAYIHTNHWAFSENSGFVDKYTVGSYVVVAPSYEFDPLQDSASLEFAGELFPYTYHPEFGVVGDSYFLYTFLNGPQDNPADLEQFENHTFTYDFGESISNYKFQLESGALYYLDPAYATYDQNSRKITWQTVAGARNYYVRVYPTLADASPDHFQPRFSTTLPADATEYTYPESVLIEPGDFVAVQANSFIVGVGINHSRFHVKVPETYVIGSFSVQQREYHGKEYHGEFRQQKKINRLSIEMKDSDGENISEDVIVGCHLFDPNGHEVELSDFRYSTNKIWSGDYYSSNGCWVYNNNGFAVTGNYAAEFADNLVAGTYRLEVEDKYGINHSAENDFTPLSEFPVIKNVMQHFDKNGNLTVTWKAPDAAIPFVEDPNREIYGVVGIFLNNPDYEYLYYCLKIPFHMGQAFIPKQIIEEIGAAGDDAKICVQLRTKDQNYRSYSKYSKLKKNRFW